MKFLSEFEDFEWMIHIEVQLNIDDQMRIFISCIVVFHLIVSYGHPNTIYV